jgi:hypothetical protein
LAAKGNESGRWVANTILRHPVSPIASLRLEIRIPNAVGQPDAAGGSRADPAGSWGAAAQSDLGNVGALPEPWDGGQAAGAGATRPAVARDKPPAGLSICAQPGNVLGLIHAS